LLIAVYGFMLADMAYAYAKKERRLWYERLTKTQNVSTFEGK
jgi:hypothetical protein